MKTTTMALIGGAMLAAFAGMGVAACSSSPATPPNDNGQDSSTPGNDSGNPNTGTDSGNPSTGDDSSTPGTDSGGGGGDGGTTCKNPTLHPGTAGSIFCGYNDAGSFSCPSGQQCCLGGKVGTSYDPEACISFGGTCQNPPPPNGGLPIQCGQISDCTANGVQGAACCLQGAGAPAVVAGCTYYKSSGGSGVVCEAPDGGAAGDGGASDGGGGAVPSCAAGEIQICSANSDCPTGKTCTPMKWKLYDMGFCQ